MEDEISQNSQDVSNSQEIQKDNENLDDLVRANTERNISVTPTRPVATKFALPQNVTIHRPTKRGSSVVEAQVSKHLKQASDALTNLTTRPQTKTFQDAPALYGHLPNKIDNLVFKAELNENDFSNSEIQRVSTTIISSSNYVSSTPSSSP